MSTKPQVARSANAFSCLFQHVSKAFVERVLNNRSVINYLEFYYILY
ncbi:hypothetical protein HMPREF1991_00565 [Hoylesella loescheii DSM 19665 = JCM 12249 = ATCC 15930]|uniref:Uncharacterized protein n=1 Tax=Hoylesella loescheii DSM 19665 = JCM 12249 = ATCC 15930 TaxID=1122985 RepID=A0A069QKZ7_HOYLO|nr:hypothetical protein HMPREF1991_00565 [Hoylesella loescheii DSM 19665 = JCM 12249 = ATCC 15930]